MSESICNGCGQRGYDGHSDYCRVQLAELRKDKARLDLIEAYADSPIIIASHKPGWSWHWTNDQPLREFLDGVAEQRAAMEAEDE